MSQSSAVHTKVQQVEALGEALLRLERGIGGALPPATRFGCGLVWSYDLGHASNIYPCSTNSFPTSLSLISLGRC